MSAGILLSVSDMRPVSIDALWTDVLVPPDAYAPVFLQHRALLCSDLIEPDFLANLIARCRSGNFVADHVDRLGSREIEAPSRVGAILTLALARPALLRWLEAATGCGPLTRVDGRVIQARANGIDALDWHDDRGNLARRLAITINLSDRDYDGGIFELREVASQRPLTTHRHDRPGSALIFDVADDIEHRVWPVTAGGPRRVYTGWFLGAVRPLSGTG